MYIVICDDDINYAQNCKQQLLQLAKKHNLHITVDLLDSGKQLLFFLDTKYAKCDLVYLDHNMPGLNGMETARALRDKGVIADIVFVTVDDSHAIEAFDVNAFHYIVKGKIGKEKFEWIFLKAVKRIEKRSVEVLTVSCAGEHRNISTNDILYFEVMQRIITVHYYNDNKLDSFEFYSSLSKIEEFLYGKDFIRIHSSYLIGIRHIKKKKAREVEMMNGIILPIGKTYQGKVKQQL